MPFNPCTFPLWFILTPLSPLDLLAVPFFAIPDDEETESEARRLAEMSPEQKVYYRSCDHYKVKALRLIMKQIDSMDMVLAHTRFADMELKAFTTSLVMNFSVKRLDLTDTMLSERQMTYLNDFLEDDNGITDLILADNRLEGRTLARLFDSMRFRDVIVYLNLSGNHIRDKDLPMLTAYVESSSQLNHLHIARNKISSKAGDVLGKMMEDSEPALRSVGALLARVQVPPPMPWPDGGSESLRSSSCGLN
ncbi:leucine-rich repeat-containing 74b [Plakobranchus ocellatus]|uniref:Leucine-rich repeat-containing 74b n=1 Tax=Plakobranchus ocellatus TaxID=259542 RepID=A0AAV3Z0E2_9GAST|nr:leucine-rich repeat-containing 74b [Plakobranchus ocellatus]